MECKNYNENKVMYRSSNRGSADAGAVIGGTIKGLYVLGSIAAGFSVGYCRGKGSPMDEMLSDILFYGPPIFDAIVGTVNGAFNLAGKGKNASEVSSGIVLGSIIGGTVGGLAGLTCAGLSWVAGYGTGELIDIIN